MKLSMWHCEALYVIGGVRLNSLVELSGISYAAVHGSIMCDKWDAKRNKYLSLDEAHAYDVYTINLILTAFSHEPSKCEFVFGLLEKLRNKEFPSNGKSDIRRKQHVAMLSEFGVDAETASTLVSNIEKDIDDARGGSGGGSGGNVLPVPHDEFEDMKLGMQDELDTINSGYRYLVNAHDANSSQIHDDLREKIKFFSSMIRDIEAKMPSTLSFEELISAQRNIRHAASAYASLVQLHYDTGGLKGYVNHHAAVAKLFGQGYMVIKRDEMGRLIESSGNSSS